MSKEIEVKKFFFIDEQWDSEYNSDSVKKLKSIKYFDLKLFKEIKPAIENIKSLEHEIIFVLIRGKMYQDYYFELKKLKPTLKCRPISFIFTRERNKYIYQKNIAIDKNLNKETNDSFGDEYYNKGRVVSTISELIQSIENLLGHEIDNEKYQENLFHFEVIKGDYENCAIPCLYSKVQSRDTLINTKEINKFNMRINTLHPYDKLSKFLNDLLKLEENPIQSLTNVWIKYFTGENTLYKTMHEEFRRNNFTNYKTFCKALLRGLEKKYLKSKFDVPLYYGAFIPKDDFENLEKKINESKKELIYSRQILSFSQDRNVSFNYIKNNKDKSCIPVLLEINTLKSPEAYSVNVDFENLSTFPEEKKVEFLPYSCFVIEDKISDNKESGLKYKLIKLNYLGNYSEELNKKIKDLDKEKIEKLLDGKNKSKFVNDIKIKFKNEFPELEQYDLIKWLNTESELIKEKLVHQYPENIIKIEMKKPGKFLSDDFFKNYHWMLKVYFDKELQEEATNEIIKPFPPKITIEIDYPIFDCEKMFYLCDNIKEINFVQFDASHVTNMSMMFSDCDSLVKVNVDDFNTSKVTNMSCMFYKCSSLKKLNLSKFKTSNVTDISAMFLLCSSLRDLSFDLSKMDLKNLKDMSFVFRGCYSLDNYDLSNFDVSKINYRDGYI